MINQIFNIVDALLHLLWRMMVTIMIETYFPLEVTGPMVYLLSAALLWWTFRPLTIELKYMWDNYLRKKGRGVCEDDEE